MSETILVVDDEENIRHTLRGVLADEGFEVLEAPDGRRALELLQHAAPRLAIVDVWMPEMDGIELVERMRNQAPGVPITVISAHGPLATGASIVVGSSLSGESVPALVDHIDSTGYATTLVRGGMVAKTVEHLMATLHGYGVTNLLVKMQAEVPILDGSALELCALLDESGLVDQPATVEELVIDQRYAAGSDDPARKGI